MLAIETHELTKTYQGIGGCQGISLAVPQGSIFGLLGPNGAGKSTLVKMLVGLLHPTAGEAKILGKPIGDVTARKRVGFLPENFAYHDWLTGKDLLRFHASLYGLGKSEAIQRIPQVLTRIGLKDQRGKKIGDYSKGMQQRIGLGCALVADPDVLFLDEPTSALDPIGRKDVRDLLVALKAEGKTVFINSHLLSELETVCDQIAIIKESRLIFQGDWREIVNKGTRVKVITGKQPLPQEINASGGFNLVSHRDLSSTGESNSKLQELIFTCPAGNSIPLLVEHLVQKGFQIHEVTPITDSLETMFFQYISNSTE